MAPSSSRKLRVEALFLLHTIFALAVGVLAFVLPNFFEYFFIPHGEASLKTRDDADKIEHLTIRLYGALILAQAWITHNARAIKDAHTRRALVQAYCGTFTLTCLALLRAQLTPGGNLSAWNWLNIFAFAGLGARGGRGVGGGGSAARTRGAHSICLPSPPARSGRVRLFFLHRAHRGV